MITVSLTLLYLLCSSVSVEANSKKMEVLDDILQRLRAANEGIAQAKADFSNEFEVAKSKLDRFNDTSSSLGNSIRDTQIELQAEKNQITATQTTLVDILSRLNDTEQDLEGVHDDMSQSEEKLESIKESFNLTLSKLESGRKEEVSSRWDVLYSEKFLNKKLTREMTKSKELESTGNLLGKMAFFRMISDTS